MPSALLFLAALGIWEPRVLERVLDLGMIPTILRTSPDLLDTND